jgi:hypothetical protein
MKTALAAACNLLARRGEAPRVAMKPAGSGGFKAA